MKPIDILSAAAISLVSLSASGQTSGASTFVERGLSAYVKDGPSAAMQSWLKGSALEGNPQALSQANTLRQIEELYGKAESYHVVSTHAISPKATMVFAVLNYEKGPLFIRMQA